MTIHLQDDWGVDRSALSPKTERVLRAVAVDAPAAHTFGAILSALAGATLSPRHVSARLSQLRNYGWIENAGGMGHTSRWRVRADALHALAPRGALPTRPGDSPATTRRPAAPPPVAPAPDLVPPARRNWRDQPAWQPPAWESARAGADDFLAVPSRGVLTSQGGAR